MRFFFALVAALLLAQAQAAGQVYKVTDEEGNVTYTDKPPSERERGEAVDLPEVNTQPPVRVTTPESRQETDESAAAYQRVTIASPGHEQTIPPGQVEVPVQVATEPALRAGHRVRILYDGQPYAPASTATTVVMSGLERGAHQIQAQILDSDNQVVATTGAVTIYVKQHSRLHPAPGFTPGGQ